MAPSASMLPSRTLIGILAALSLGFATLAFSPLPTSSLELLAGLAAAALLALFIADVCLSIASRRRCSLGLRRSLPRAFAVGVPVAVRLNLDNPGDCSARGMLFELADPSLGMPAMPLRFAIAGGSSESLEFTLTPTRRGCKRFEAAQILLRSTLGLFDWNLRIGASESRRVFPNFEHQAGFGWLAGDRRLAKMGIKSVRRRGSGTDFDQLVEYRAGDPIRQIDWKATLKHSRPIARKFQDERDQSVMFLLDCGRRMRADDSQQGSGATHFDQALNALMLLAFVALSHGDAVGAITFGTPQGMEKRFAPRKGRQTLNALMAELGDVEPTPTYSDYTRAAADLMQRQRKRGLLIVITNFRDEDAGELAAALRLLRSRHMVILASLREQIVATIAEQPLTEPHCALEAAAALKYAQSRTDVLRRLGVTGLLTIDCEPQRLGVELVTRYEALKRAGSI
jgi:uncharacterized protein (DUF58 family)